jgi:transposase
LLARRAVEAAASQHITLPGEELTAQIVQTLAHGILALHAQIAEIDKLIAARFRQHPDAAIIESLPGFGPLLGAEFLAITGGDITRFETPDRLAGLAGLAPVPRDSGRISGNLHRPKRYHRGLQRVFYYSAMNSIRWSDEEVVPSLVELRRRPDDH